MTLFGAQAGPVAQAAVYPGPTARYRATLSYLGGGFHGFASQPGQVTVAGVLGAALERSLRHTVDLTCAGRTDAGVHARRQVVSFEARADADVEAVMRSVNRALRPAVVLSSLDLADPGFDARRWATGRRYRYTVLNQPILDPFSAHTSWHVPSLLDVRAMQLACDPLIGSHDFTSFCRRPPAGSLVRLVRSAEWDSGSWDAEEGGLLSFEIEASSFCQQMVRSLVGTLVEVGSVSSRRRAGDMTSILHAHDRGAAGRLAPPHGLCLWDVTYPPSGPPPSPDWVPPPDCC